MSYSDSAYASYQKLRERMKNSPTADRLYFTFLFTFIVVAAFFQGMPAVFQGGTEETNKKYKLYFNYLCPELRQLIFNNGTNMTNLVVSSLASFAFAGLALAGLKEMIEQDNEEGIRQKASLASKIYSVSASVPGAFLTAAFFPGMFDSWPFSEVRASEQEIEKTGYVVGGAVLASNLIMYGSQVGDDVIDHAKYIWNTVRHDPSVMKKIAVPMVALYTYYMQTLQQMASLGKNLNQWTDNKARVEMDLLAAIPSVAYADFVFKIMLDMGNELYEKFIIEIAITDDGKVKKAFELMFTTANVFKLFLNIILLLPLFAMYLDWMGGALEMTHTPKDFNTIVDNPGLNLFTLQLPALQAAIISVYLAHGIPGTVRSVARRLWNGPPAKLKGERAPLLPQNTINISEIEA